MRAKSGHANWAAAVRVSPGLKNALSANSEAEVNFLREIQCVGYYNCPTLYLTLAAIPALIISDFQPQRCYCQVSTVSSISGANRCKTGKKNPALNEPSHIVTTVNTEVFGVAIYT